MAPAAVTENPALAALDEAHKPPPGIVLPPKEIRVVVEKTAGYVVRNGAHFEDRIKQNNTNNPKFSFLNPGDAYAPFYKWRMDEIKAGRGTDVAAGREGQAAAKQPEKPKGPAEPPQFHFSARMPNINAQDLDVVRLTALFVAKNGRSWMAMLSQREAGNAQFDFLRAQHSLHQYFQRLVDQYKELLGIGVLGEKQRVQELEHNVRDKYHILERAKQRAEWIAFQEKQKQKKDEEAEAEALAFQQIDWDDFNVVETILITEEDEQSDLPPLMPLHDLQALSLEDKAKLSMVPASMRIEEAMPTDDVSYYQQPVQQPIQQSVQMLASQPAYFPSLSPSVPFEPPKTYEEDEEERAIRERAEARERTKQVQAAARGTGKVRIRDDYNPRNQARKQNQGMGLCPNCQRMYPVGELEQHIKIELLDPSWREQRAKADARNSTTNLTNADVANNLKRLASQRDDVFDSATGLAISEEEAARRKRVAAQSYDGQPETRDAARNQMPALTVQEQIRQIHEKHRKDKDT